MALLSNFKVRVNKDIRQYYTDSKAPGNNNTVIDASVTGNVILHKVYLGHDSDNFTLEYRRETTVLYRSRHPGEGLTSPNREYLDLGGVNIGAFSAESFNVQFNRTQGSGNTPMYFVLDYEIV